MKLHRLTLFLLAQQNNIPKLSYIWTICNEVKMLTEKSVKIKTTKILTNKHLQYIDLYHYVQLARHQDTSYMYIYTCIFYVIYI